MFEVGREFVLIFFKSFEPKFGQLLVPGKHTAMLFINLRRIQSTRIRRAVKRLAPLSLNPLPFGFEFVFNALDLA